MYVRAGRGAGHGGAKGYERDALPTQVGCEGLPFAAVGMERHVNRMAMVEAKPIMRRRLAYRARRQRTSESR